MEGLLNNVAENLSDWNGLELLTNSKLDYKWSRLNGNTAFTIFSSIPLVTLGAQTCVISFCIFTNLFTIIEIRVFTFIYVCKRIDLITKEATSITTKLIKLKKI